MSSVRCIAPGGSPPVAFVAIYVRWTVLLLPGVVLTPAGGALFGVAVGSLLTLIGPVIGATVAFLVGRRLGRVQVQQFARRRAVRFEQWLRDRGFLGLLYARLVPIGPFNLLNYAAGVTGMSTRAYVIATAVGIAPGTVAYTALGSAAEHPGSTPLIVSATAVGLLTLIVGALSRHRPLAGR
jgi:uncharacterized membrane protein YdjX (TVP38/TMEM64 family)